MTKLFAQLRQYANYAAVRLLIVTRNTSATAYIVVCARRAQSSLIHTNATCDGTDRTNALIYT